MPWMTHQPLRIAVDAMGGDLGPAAVVEGVARAARDLAGVAQFTVVGKAEEIAPLLRRFGAPQDAVAVQHASEVCEPGEAPAEAVRFKKDASVVVAARMVGKDEADAFVSIGHTGAAMAAAVLNIGRIDGVDRPAIAVIVPTRTRPAVILDVGANVDCDSDQILQFAAMGAAYCRVMLGRTEPRVGLLSNGEEDGKGNELIKRSHPALRQYMPGFIGNVEAGEAFRGVADVVVCDGFVGNVMLKCAEGVAEFVLAAMREELVGHPWLRVALLPLVPAMRRLRAKLDYRAFGGAPLLGVKKTCIVGHGRSDALAVERALHVTIDAVRAKLVDAIGSAVQELKARMGLNPMVETSAS